MASGGTSGKSICDQVLPCIPAWMLGGSCDSAGEESACNAGDLGSIPALGRSPWRRERLPTPVFWPREFHGLYGPWAHKESDTTEQLSHCYISNVPHKKDKGN